MEPRGFLDGKLLIDMPGMSDERFARAVIYICAHSSDGAMGLIVNRPAENLDIEDLLRQLKLVENQQEIRLPERACRVEVLNGGPMDRSRGFVLHTDDYRVDSSLPVAEDICLTATVDILRAISKGRGPRRALMALGYSGWGAGQLESEIIDNGWLTCPADPDLLFDSDMDRKYGRVLAAIGIDESRLSSFAGHA